MASLCPIPEVSHKSATGLGSGFEAPLAKRGKLSSGGAFNAKNARPQDRSPSSGRQRAEGTVGRTIMENLMRSTGRTLVPGQPAPRDGLRHRLPAEHRSGAGTRRPGGRRHAGEHRARRAARVRQGRRARRDRGLGRLRRDRQGRTGAREAHQEDPAATTRCASWAPTASASSGRAWASTRRFCRSSPSRATSRSSRRAERWAPACWTGPSAPTSASRCSPRWAAWSTSTSRTWWTSSARIRTREASSSTWRPSGTRGAS